MARIAYHEFKWVNEDGTVDYSTHKMLECKNHPEMKYSTKGPGRSLHMIGAGLTKECECKLADLVVITAGSDWTTTIKQDIGTYALQHSGPAHSFIVEWYGSKVAVFEDLDEAIFYVNAKREFKGFDPVGASTDGFTVTTSK